MDIRRSYYWDWRLLLLLSISQYDFHFHYDNITEQQDGSRRDKYKWPIRPAHSILTWSFNILYSMIEKNVYKNSFISLFRLYLKFKFYGSICNLGKIISTQMFVLLITLVWAVDA